MFVKIKRENHLIKFRKQIGEGLNIESEVFFPHVSLYYGKESEENKIKVQFGHSLADCKCCVNIMKKYNIGFTHLYNAMSGNDHRSPGVLSAALSKGKYAEMKF